MQSLTNAKIAETDDIATEEQQRKWIEQRKALRVGLDEMGISERWLCSKTRTPLENSFLAEIRERRKKAITCDQMKQSETEVIIVQHLKRNFKNGFYYDYTYIQSRKKFVERYRLV